WVSARSTGSVSIVDPVTEDVLIDVPVAGAADINEVIAAAGAAARSGPWSTTSAMERSAAIGRLADRLSERSELLAQLWTAQVGAPISLTTRLVGEGIARLRYYAKLGRDYAFERMLETGRDTALIR